MIIFIDNINTRNDNKPKLILLLPPHEGVL